jgi:hypothetical protein
VIAKTVGGIPSLRPVRTELIADVPWPRVLIILKSQLKKIGALKQRRALKLDGLPQAINKLAMRLGSLKTKVFAPTLGYSGVHDRHLR